MSLRHLKAHPRPLKACPRKTDSALSLGERELWGRKKFYYTLLSSSDWGNNSISLREIRLTKRTELNLITYVCAGTPHT